MRLCPGFCVLTVVTLLALLAGSGSGAAPGAEAPQKKKAKDVKGTVTEVKAATDDPESEELGAVTVRLATGKVGDAVVERKFTITKTTALEIAPKKKGQHDEPKPAKFSDIYVGSVLTVTPGAAKADVADKVLVEGGKKKKA